MCARPSITIPSEKRAERLARGALFYALGRSLADPVQAPRLRRAEAETARAAAELLGDGVAAALAGELLRTRPRDEEAARAAYTNVFGLLVSPEAPPYEVEWEARTDVFWRAERLAEIAGFYRAFGVAVAGRERPDHVSLEADFLWYLSERSVAGRELGHSPEKVALTDRAFERFLGDHFSVWAPSFADALAAVAARRGEAFYGAAARLLGRVAARERGRLGLGPARPRRPAVEIDREAAAVCGPCAAEAACLAASGRPTEPGA